MSYQVSYQHKIESKYYTDRRDFDTKSEAFEYASIAVIGSAGWQFVEICDPEGDVILFQESDQEDT